MNDLKQYLTVNEKIDKLTSQMERLETVIRTSGEYDKVVAENKKLRKLLKAATKGKYNLQKDADKVRAKLKGETSISRSLKAALLIAGKHIGVVPYTLQDIADKSFLSLSRIKFLSSSVISLLSLKSTSSIS